MFLEAFLLTASMTWNFNLIRRLFLKRVTNLVILFHDLGEGNHVQRAAKVPPMQVRVILYFLHPRSTMYAQPRHKCKNLSKTIMFKEQPQKCNLSILSKLRILEAH